LTTIYTVVKREIDGNDEWYVEYFDDTLQCDSAKTGGASESFASVPHLEDKTVNIILDGAVQPTEVVSSGTVTFDRASADNWQVGLNYTVRVVTMPAELQLQVGTRLAFKKRIVEVNAIVKDTQHLKVNNILVPFRNFDAPPVLDLPVPEYTGIKTINGILGYTKEGKITIEQDIPLKMILLGLEYKIATHQGT